MFNLNFITMSKNIDVAAIMTEAAKNFQSVETSSEVLPAGQHNVQIVGLAISHSFANYDGSLKDKTFEWETPTPLVMVTFADGSRAIVHRYHILGYKKYEDLTAKQKESGDYEPSEEGYALKDGDRIVDEDNTAAAQRILSQVFSAVGLKAGSTLDDLDNLVKAREAECRITVEEAETPDGKKYLEVKSVKAIKAEAPITEDSFG